MALPGPCPLVAIAVASAVLHRCHATTLMFLDDHPLNLRVNVRRVTATPQAISQYKDPAQDLCINWGYPSVFNCTPPDGGGPRLCMLYEAQTYPEHVVFMNMATSTDGVHWSAFNTTTVIPDLPGRRYSNQVLPGSSGSKECGSVIAELAPRRGLRLFCQTSMWVSEDGVRWTDTGTPWQPYPTDYPVCAFRNEMTNAWQMLARPRNSDRRIATHSFDSNWSSVSPPVLMMDTDSMDSPLAEIYGMFAWNLAGYYVAFIDMYHVPQGLTKSEIASNSPHKYLTGKSDVYLAHSLNGVHWTRTTREPIVPNGPPGTADAGLIYPTSARLDPVDQSLIVTASTSQYEHGIFSNPHNGTGSGSVITYKWRKNGLVFLESEGGIGVVGTRILYWANGEAVVNADASSGSVLCRVTDKANLPITGYDWDDAIGFLGDDSTSWTPMWTGGKGLATLAGKGATSVVRLEFQLINARLYSIEGDFHPISVSESGGPFPPLPRPGFEPGW